MASRQVRRKRALSAELSVPTEAETATSESNNSPTLASKRRRRTETPSAIELPDIEELASSVCAYTSWSEWLAQPMHHHRFDREQVSALRTKLLAWYDANKRELPWRQTPVEDPLKDVNAASQRAYQVWISEIMLQQTRVATVIDYYNRWMARFPSIQELAAASLNEVNELWSGLGYYRRAKMLHQAAQQVVADQNGLLPHSAAGLLAVPGIGRYTAGAIASIAYNESTPVVDGNVMRVLSRLRAISGSIKANHVVAFFWHLAGDLVDPARPGCLNQALMELGATVCTPTSPSCTECPVSEYCVARKASLEHRQRQQQKLLATTARRTDASKVESVPSLESSCTLCDASVVRADEPPANVTLFPVKPKKAAPRDESVFVCIVERRTPEREFLMVQRPAEGLLASLWEFPSLILPSAASSAKAKREQDSDSSDSETESRQRQKQQQAEIKITAPQHRRMREYITTLLGPACATLLTPSSTFDNIGTTSHLFSHIRQQLAVHHVRLLPEDGEGALALPRSCEPEVTPQWKWSTESELHSSAISTGTRKCFSLLESHEAKRTKHTTSGKASAATSTRGARGSAKSRSKPE